MTARTFLPALLLVPALISVSQMRTVEHQGSKDEVGTLLFDVQPGTATVFIDGHDAGQGLMSGGLMRLDVPAGRHSVELRAPGRAWLDFDTTVVAGETTIHRVVLFQSQPLLPNAPNVP